MHKTLKVVSFFLAVLLAVSAIATAAVSAFLLWGTRREAVPGTYHANGVWGTSTLTLRPDHTSRQEVQFMEYDQPSVSPYRQHPTRHEVIDGRWEEDGRELFDRKIVIKPIMGMARWDQGKVYDFEGSYGPVALSGLGIEVDIGASIVYRK